MGGLLMDSTGRFSSPQEYVDDQFTCSSEHQQGRVLRSAVVGQTYQAAVALIPADQIEIVGLVRLLQYEGRPFDRQVGLQGLG